MQLPKTYVRARDEWQIPLEKKRLRRERKKELLEAQGTALEPEMEDEKFIVHFPGLPLQLPTPQDKIFAIVNIKGRQYK